MGLKKLLDEKGISQYRLAKEAGLGMATISEIVRGIRKEPRMSTCSLIAEVLEVDVSEVYNAIKEEE